MTKAFEDMLYLLGNSTHKPCELPAGQALDIESIRKFAIAQGTWPFVWYSLNERSLAAKYKKEALRMVCQNMCLQGFHLQTINKLEDSGVTCCLLKGASVSDCYLHPELRLSSDTDILINPKDEKKASDILKNLGYNVQPRNLSVHHFNAKHPSGGLLEVHVRLYDKIVERYIFDNIDIFSYNFIKTNIYGFSVNILNPQDALLFLTSHYIKHFAGRGSGIRPMLDILIHTEKYKNEINFDEYFNYMKKLRYEKLIRTVFSIGNKYFGFNFPFADDEKMEILLDDAEKRGIFGGNKNVTNTFYEDFCRMRSGESISEFSKSLRKDSSDGFFRTIFPRKRTYINSYGFLYAKHTALIPIAWVHRIIFVLFKKIKKTSYSNAEKNNVLNLMSELGMIRE